MKKFAAAHTTWPRAHQSGVMVVATGAVLLMLMLWAITVPLEPVQKVAVTAHDDAPEPKDARVLALMERLTLRQKIGQMTQVDITTFTDENDEIDDEKLRVLTETWPIGSILNSPHSGQKLCPTPAAWTDIITRVQDAFTSTGHKIPAIYGLDSVHGANYVLGATMFPHQIGQAATFNRTVPRVVGEITAKDTRAIGVQWNFSPIADIAVEPVWPRVYETFGEDPYLAAEMVTQSVHGQQGFPMELNSTMRVAATVKHFIGYSATRTGFDRQGVWLPERILYEYFVPPFRAAIDAGAATVMESYQDINGKPTCSSERYLKKLLRDELRFNGTLVTDWAEIYELHNYHHVAKNVHDALTQAMQKTSIDMSMVPLRFIESMKIMTDLVEKGVVPMERIDESVYRILKLKQDLGMLDGNRDAIYPNQQRIATIGSDEDRQVSFEAALESITLLKNNHQILPIRPSVKSILLVGPTAACLRCLAGGWTLRHQGAEFDEDFLFGDTIEAALRAEAGADVKITFMAGTDLNSDAQVSSDKQLARAAAEADLVIVALGEGPYAESPGDISDLRLPPNQLRLVEVLSKAAGIEKMLMVLVEGRPRNLERSHEFVAGIVQAWVPGLEGGRALAQLLFNRHSFSGRLPMSYPDSLSTGVVQHYRRVTESYKPLFPFGHGLSYSVIKYSNLTVNHVFNVGRPGAALSVSLVVKNEGPYRQKHSVLLFANQVYRTIVPEAQKLVRFTKIELDNGESTTVQFQLYAHDLEFYGGEDGQIHRTIEAGEWRLRVGDVHASFVAVI